MKNFVKNHKAFFVLSIILTAIVITLIVFTCLKQNQDFAEKWVRNVSSNYVKFVTPISNSVPFSFTEFSVVLMVTTIIFLLSWGFCLLGTKHLFGFLNRLLICGIIIVGVMTVYTSSVGFAYNRKPLPLETYKGEIKKEEFVDIVTSYVNDYNHCIETLGIDDKGEIKMPYSEDKLKEVLKSQFVRLEDGYYYSTVSDIKPLISSGIFTSFGIVGLYFGPVAEANYNTYMTNAEKPMYMIHEMCHSVGVMREDDAQLLAFYLLLKSGDEYLKYSAYVNTFDSILNVLHYTGNNNDYNNVKSLISEDIYKNYDYMYHHWEHKMFMYDLGDKINDWYLKVFGQKNGTNSYDDTKEETDDEGQVISLSNYQGIYFRHYYETIN